MIPAGHRAAAIVLYLAGAILINGIGANERVAIANGLIRQNVTESIMVDAPPEKVWSLVGDFSQPHHWLPMVTDTESQGGNEAGAQRILSLGPNLQIFETLYAYNARTMSYTYRIPDDTHDVSILPVNDYFSTISVKADGDMSLVTWQGEFYRAYPNNDPPKELDDAAAVRAVTTLYKAGLQNLKVVIENE